MLIGNDTFRMVSNCKVYIVIVKPLYLGKIKPYQNVSLLFAGALWLIASILFCSKLTPELLCKAIVVTALVFTLTFTILSVPFMLTKTELAVISEGVLKFPHDIPRFAYKIEYLKFYVNVEGKLLDSRNISEKDLSSWGNYVIVPGENPGEETKMLFRPNEGFFKFLPPLNITSLHKPILQANTNKMLHDIAIGLGGVLRH